jgi:phospholipase C
MRLPTAFGLVSALALIAAGAGAVAEDSDDLHHVHTATPIKHLVVIFQENVSFDHYFGTYPKAMNLAGETPFHASGHTPVANNLVTPLDVNNHFVPLTGVDLLNNNPNNNPNAPVAPNNNKSNGASPTNPLNPIRLSAAQALTNDQGHNESPEESAYNNGHMDGFPAFVGTAGPPPAGTGANLVMGYFDGNTTTAIWNYAQHFALNDNSYTSQFGPSTPGALNLISGQTNGLADSMNVFKPGQPGVLAHGTHETFGDAAHLTSNITVIGDGDPLHDVCSNPTGDQVQLAGKNIGDLLNAKNITWGSFMGGFDLSVVNANGTTGCARETDPTAPGTPAFTSVDYIPHHAWFQYYASTSNPTHRRPSSVKAIGHSFIPGTKTPEPANHNYDINDFFAALNADNLPAVSILKAPAFEDGHAGYSDPLDEQHFLVKVINALQNSPEWSETAVVLAYDDSDGWYDHQMPAIVNASNSAAVDTLNGPGVCNTSNGFQQGKPSPAATLNGNFGQPVFGRCGYGTRMPLLVVSPFARRNHIDHTLTDQTSVLRFIEDNWLDGARIQPGGSFDTIAGSLNSMFDFDDHNEDEPRKLILDEATGQIILATDDDDRDHDRH